MNGEFPAYIAFGGEGIEPRGLGGKAAGLCRLARAGLPVPPWFVVLPEAFEACLDPAARSRARQSGDPVVRRALLDELEVPAAVADVLHRAARSLAGGEGRLAVRSSAGEEDGLQWSFAGQLDTFLFVTPGEVAARVVEVWRSGVGDRVLAYRAEQGLSGMPPLPAVIVQRMVDARCAGVAFGADPVTGRRGVAVVSAVYGLGSGLVSGECDADTWKVDRDGVIVERNIAHKSWMHRHDPGTREGVGRVAVAGRQADMPVLEDHQVAAVAAMARRAGGLFGRPQDIEWAYDGEDLVILQSRAITSLAGLPDPDGEVAIWDNSNIAESYRGVTTPLTFSFARRAYGAVYREFCRLMGVPESVIKDHDAVFRRMLGLVRGRVYYNLLSWYRVLALLPGFRVNHRFMEQMMGVKEGLPGDVLEELRGGGWRGRARDAARVLWAMARLVLHHLVFPLERRAFERRFERALQPPRPPLSRMRPDELVRHYDRLEARLLYRWDAPLVNDFFAMIHFGLLVKLAGAWCGDGQGALANDLLVAEGGLVSAEPARRIREMARLAADHPSLVAALCAGDKAAAEREMAGVPAFRTAYESYLERFGDRCLEELKLESPTLHDDPGTLLRTVGGLARRGPAGGAGEAVETRLRRAAEERVRRALAGRPMRRLIFAWVLRHARARVRDRENLRFDRTRLFGRVRQVMVALGERLYALDVLDDPRDVFFLELEEVMGFVDGTSTTTDLRGLARVRRAEFDGWRTGPAPPDRFETRGPVACAPTGERSASAAIPRADEVLKGLGCCPGVVRGRVRVVADPRDAHLEPGEILVAERTDPGWIMLFPAAAGVLVEHGSLLSHSAIVARELGIPAVVGLAGVTRWVRDGDEVELDGQAGTVCRVAGQDGR